MKIGSIGSCLSNMIVSRMMSRFGGDRRFHVYRHRSDQFYHYHINKDKNIVPRDYIEKNLVVEKLESSDPNFVSSSEILNNQYEKIGKHGMSHEKSFFDILKNEKLDIIVLDNYLDMAAILSYPKLKDYVDSPIFLRKSDYSNYDDFFTFGDKISIEDSAYYFNKIIMFLRILQPTASIYFLHYPYNTYINNPNRQLRAQKFEILFETNEATIIPAPFIKKAFQIEDDPAHFEDSIYVAYSGYLYLDYKTNKSDKERKLINHFLKNGKRFDTPKEYFEIEEITFESEESWTVAIKIYEFENDQLFNFFFGKRGTKNLSILRRKNKLEFRADDDDYIGGVEFLTKMLNEVVVTYDKGNFVFYNNGKISDVVFHPSTAAFNAIGSGYDGKNHEQACVISKVAVWKRALNLEEIPKCFEKGFLETGADLIDRWDFTNDDINKKEVLNLKYREYPDYCVSVPLDWSLDPYTNNNWCHNFYSLRWIPFYIQQWIKNKRKGVNPLLYVQDFLEYHDIDKNKKNNFYMSKSADHTMIERLEVFSNIWLELVAGNTDYEVIDKELFKKEIIKLVEVLLGDSVYRKSSNHGFMIDMGLIEFALKLPELNSDNKILEIAEKRIALQLDTMFDQYGINKEHSVSYQEFDAGLCVDLLGIYTNYNRKTSLLARIHSIIATSFHFLKYCVKPNGENHRIGDTFALPNQRLIKKVESAYDKLPDQYKEKLESLFGLNEKNGLLIAPEAGFAVIRDQYGANETDDTFHLFFTAAWHSHIHKQNDDLSFSLYSDGFSVIEDPGYSDAVNDTSYRSEYIHNTHTCEGHEWNKRTSIDRKTKLSKYYQSDNIYAIQGSHDRIENIHIERTLIYLLPKILVILDYFQTDDEEKRNIKSRFNLGENIKNLTEISNGYEINVNNKKTRIIQKSSNDFMGNIEDTFILNRNGSKIQSKSIVFNNIINNHDSIVTIIDLSDEQNSNIEIIRYSTSEFSISTNGKKENITMGELTNELYFNRVIES